MSTLRSTKSNHTLNILVGSWKVFKPRWYHTQYEPSVTGPIENHLYTTLLVISNEIQNIGQSRSMYSVYTVQITLHSGNLLYFKGTLFDL